MSLSVNAHEVISSYVTLYAVRQSAGSCRVFNTRNSTQFHLFHYCCK